MKLFFKYGITNLTVALVVILFGLICALWLTQSIRLIEFVIAGGASFYMFVKLLFLTLPSFLYLILPIAALISVLFVYNKMLQDNELVVLKSAGMSTLQLMMPALAFAILLTLFSFSLTIEYAPKAQKKMTMIQETIKNDFSAFMIREGVFVDISKSLTVFVSEKSNKGELFGVLIYDTRQKEKPVTIFAQSGQIVELDESKGRVLIYNGSRQEYNEETGRIGTLNFAEYKIDLDQFKRKTTESFKDVKEKNFSDLWASIAVEEKPLRKNKMITEMHRRFTIPLYILGFTVLGASVLLNSSFSRRGFSKHIVLIMVSAMVIRFVGLMLEKLAIKNPVLTPLLYILPLAPIFYFAGYGSYTNLFNKMKGLSDRRLSYGKGPR